eukprot:s1312_g7.t3
MLHHLLSEGAGSAQFAQGVVDVNGETTLFYAVKRLRTAAAKALLEGFESCQLCRQHLYEPLMQERKKRRLYDNDSGLLRPWPFKRFQSCAERMFTPGGRRKVRTAADPPMPPDEALKMLKDGNRRFVKGEPQATRTNESMRNALVDMGQAPHTAVIGCADSRAPLETIFDAMPGDIFVLRNAGNTCTHAEGSMVGSLEFSTGKLGAQLILVLGHTKCGAIYGATNAYLEAKKSEVSSVNSALEGLLLDLAPVAEKALADIGSSDAETVAAHAVRVNVFHTIDFLLKYSAPIREKVKNGQLEIQGGIYHLDSGNVEFMGRSPSQAELLSSKVSIPPSMTREGGRTSGYGPAMRGTHGVRTGVDSAIAAEDALKMLKDGNERFAVGAPLAKHATSKMREALVSHGQAPHTAVFGCADSRVPVDTIFDAMPGDLFVLRNAGNTCTHAEGSMVGSLEFCAGKLGSKLILVLGHTQCGAIAGATKTYLGSKDGPTSKNVGCALEGLLIGLSRVAQQAEDELGVGAELDTLVAHSVKVNVFHSIDFLLKFSEPLRELVKSGSLEIQGGIYHLETGRVEFLGRSPRQSEFLTSDSSLPPSLQALPIRTTVHGWMPHPEALKLLKEGNERFAVGGAIAGRITPAMRKALVKEGQAPHTAIIGCADSRAPLETVFDAMPGDIFVLRNAGNTCTHAEGSMVGSLEFCLGALNTKMVMVLGHTACGAIKGATKTFLQSKGSKTVRQTKAARALDALLQGLSIVASKSAEELGPTATEEQITSHAVKLLLEPLKFGIQPDDSEEGLKWRSRDPGRHLRPGDRAGGISGQKPSTSSAGAANRFYHAALLVRMRSPPASRENAWALADALEASFVEQPATPYRNAMSQARPIDAAGKASAMMELPFGHPLARDGAGVDGRVRTSGDPPVPPELALKFLKEGNQRFVDGKPQSIKVDSIMRKELDREGQAPHTAIIGCADSRCPLETLFDTLPGDIFVLRNAGNTCTHAEGLLFDLAPVADKALQDSVEAIAAHAVRVNVFHTVDFLLKHSAPIREKVRSGQVEIQGGLYHLDTGKVEFMGRSPKQEEILKSIDALTLPPSMTREGGRTLGYGPAARGTYGVRTTADAPVSAEDALKMLKAGNERFAVGAPLAKHATLKMREALVSHGQAPHTAILGCADSRVPVDTVFDAMPGSMVGSLEFCAGKLGSKLIMVMGHTQCGAIAGATKTYLANKEGKGSKTAGSALEGLLIGLSDVAEQAHQQLGPGVEESKLISHTVRVNVFRSIEFLLTYSEPLRALVKSGNLEIQGGIYHLETGRVEFLGHAPTQAEVLASDFTLPPSVKGLPVRTTTDGPMPPVEALQILKDGNKRFVTGETLAGNVTNGMRKALVKEGQAPLAAIVGCADSRAPLETVFDAMPGDIFVLRNAGNTCTHAEGSIVGSLEFCIGALGTKMVMVLGHTACGAIKGATATHLQLKAGHKPKVTKALDALLQGLSVVASKAADELGPSATEEQIVNHTIKLNVFHSIEFLLQYSPLIREKVASGEVEIQGGVYDLESGEVEFLGRCPTQDTLLKSGAALPPSLA